MGPPAFRLLSCLLTAGECCRPVSSSLQARAAPAPERAWRAWLTDGQRERVGFACSACWPEQMEIVLFSFVVSFHEMSSLLVHCAAICSDETNGGMQGCSHTDDLQTTTQCVPRRRKCSAIDAMSHLVLSDSNVVLVYLINCSFWPALIEQSPSSYTKKDEYQMI